MTASDPRVALITGGSRGIGFATAERFLSGGYRVVICASNEEAVGEAAQRLGDRAAGVSADLSRPEEARAAVRAVIDLTGRIDALVNCHGVLPEPQAVPEISDETWRRTIDVNLLGPIATTTAAAPHLQCTGGSIVNVSSVNAIVAERDTAPYGVTKAAIAAFTRFAAVDLGELYGVRVNAVLPGWVNTDMSRPHAKAAGVSPNDVSVNILRRFARPEEIADAIFFLCSEQSTFITGECLVIDGGQSVLTRDL